MTCSPFDLKDYFFGELNADQRGRRERPLLISAMLLPGAFGLEFALGRPFCACVRRSRRIGSRLSRIRYSSRGGGRSSLRPDRNSVSHRRQSWRQRSCSTRCMLRQRSLQSAPSHRSIARRSIRTPMKQSWRGVFRPPIEKAVLENQNAAGTEDARGREARGLQIASAGTTSICRRSPITWIDAKQKR